MTSPAAPTTQPVPQNPISSFIDKLINALVSGGEMAGKTYAITYAPWLAFPVISTLFGWLLDGLAGAIEKQTGIIVATTVNAIQKDIQNAILVDATKSLANAQASGDQNEINAALAATAQAYRSVGSFNGS